MRKHTTSLLVTALGVTALSGAAFGQNARHFPINVSPAPGGASINLTPDNSPASGLGHVSRVDRVQREKSEGTVEKVCPKCNGQRWLPFRGGWLSIYPQPIVVPCEECHGDGHVTYDLIRRRQ